MEPHTEASLTPAWLTGFFDDAAAFPPMSLSLDRAVAAHRDHQSSEYSPLLGRLVVPDVRLPDLIDLLDERDEESPLPVSLLVTGGAGAIAPAVRWASRAALIDLRAIELTLRDEDDLTHNARRVLTALDAIEEDLEDVPVFVELPTQPGGATPRWLSALDEIAAGDLRAKFRTGGVTADTFPAPESLAASIDAALDRELSFKCAGGLERAMSWTADDGALHFGFLSLLHGVRAALDGEDVAAVLRGGSGSIDSPDADALARTRRWLCSVSTTDLLESHEDVVETGLLASS